MPAKLQKFSVLPKSARSAQTVENLHSFLNVSYTCYKSLLLSMLSRIFLDFCLQGPHHHKEYQMNLTKEEKKVHYPEKQWDQIIFLVEFKNFTY